MKSKKRVQSAPEYSELLSAFDEAQSAYEQAKMNERSVKQTLKTDVKHRTKLEEDILRLTLNQAKHLRKAEKSNVRIAQLMIKLWLKTSEAAAKTKEVIVVEVVTETPAKKKRGRQPKAKAEEAEVAEATAPVSETTETVVEAAAPKKRGRQPKPKAEVVEAAEAPAPKKTGKRKEKVEAIMEVAETAAEAETVVDAEPKRRGRQAKVAVEAEVEEGVAGVSARAMEAADATDAPAAKTSEKKPRRSREEVAAQKAAEADAQKAALNGDDFRIIEGIGPKMTELLHQNGITSFQDLASKSYEDLKALVMSHRQYLAKPDTWAQQAQLVVEGKMDELAALKATLKRGV
jgi:predicted flap endonuclease-1-like 5' DNA nuclease